MFKTRLLSGIVLVILAGVTMYLGGNVLLAVCFLISVIGLTELYKILGIEKKLLGFVGYLAAAGYYGLLFFDRETYVLLLFVGFLMLLMAVYVFTFPAYKTDQVLDRKSVV